MVLKFTKDLRLFAPDLNNLSKQLRFGVKLTTDCLVTENGVPDMSVDVAAGTILFNAADVVVAGQNVVITAADPSQDRIDLIVVDVAGTASVITGTPAATPKAATYDPDTYLALARVFVDDAVTAILNAVITDIRIYNTGVGAGIDMEEIDGVPTVANVNTIKVTNGSLTDDGGGVVTLETGVGGTNIYPESFVAQTQVVVVHNLADDKPIVQVYDSNNEQITPDKIDITDLNTVTVDFAVATTGFIVVHGGTAELKNGGVGTYLHDQSGASAAWAVTHNLNDMNPVIMVYDSAGDVVEPTSIDITGANTFTVNFGGAVTGKVRVLAGKFSGSVLQNVDLIPETDDAYDIGSATFRWQDLFLSGAMTLNGNILPETDATSDIGTSTVGFKDLFLTGTITADGDFLPETHNTSDLGTTGVRFKDGYFQGKLYVVGGIDPSYIQLDPQGAEPDNTLDNKFWVDSSDSNKLKFKNNSSVNNEVVDFSHVGTGANQIVQLDGSGDLPAVGGGNLTGVPAVGTVPVGGIVAWMKSITGVPALPTQFVECNGGTVSDVESPINGQTIPTLNSGGNRMLRGSTTSGTTGGADTHTLTIAEMPAHTHSDKYAGSWSGAATGGSNRMEPPVDTNTTSSTGGGGAHNNLPGYTEVVWIMRIK